MQAEIDALYKNNAWTLVSLPPKYKIIGCKQIYKIKFLPNGSIKHYKAQLMAKSFLQTLGLNYFETFSLVVKPTTIKIVLVLTLFCKWPIC